MRKRSFWGIGMLGLTITLSAISWNHVNSKTRPQTIKKATPVTQVVEKESALEAFDHYLTDIYAAADLATTNLDFAVFKKAVTGYYNFQSGKLAASDKQIITIVDLAKASTSKRMWVIDLAARKVLFNTYAAHGQGSGDNIATNFSNDANSHQSSLGFYITSDIYFGKHGRSMKLNGMDEGFNSNARARAVVVHGADYVSESWIKTHGRLGRSHGCPAVPRELSDAIINTIKGETVLYINGGNNYTSRFLDENLAANSVQNSTPTTLATL